MPKRNDDLEYYSRRSAVLIGSILILSFSILILSLMLLKPATAQNQPPFEKATVGPPEETRVPPPEHSQAASRFAAGKWLLSGYGSAALGKTTHKVYAGHVGLAYYFIDDLSINFEGVGYFIDHSNHTGGAGVNLLPRWHYLARDEWSLYLDGGWGLIYTRDTLRNPGTHFNFTVQAGAGATYDLSDRLMALGGVRWFHISNGRIRGKNRNVGFDSPLFYMGVMLPF
jgi:hypothetical protein